MTYVTSIEALARREGREEGALRELRQMIASVLLVRFQRLRESLRAVVEATESIESLRHMVEEAVKAASLEDFERQLPSS